MSRQKNKCTILCKCLFNDPFKWYHIIMFVNKQQQKKVQKMREERFKVVFNK